MIGNNYEWGFEDNINFESSECDNSSLELIKTLYSSDSDW